MSDFNLYDYCLAGRVNDKGKLMVNMSELNMVLEHCKNSNVVLTIKPTQRKTSQALRGYYFNYIVPMCKRAAWQLGYRMTDDEVEYKLRSSCPIMYKAEPNIETGVYQKYLRGISDLNNAELVEYIDTLKQNAAENYGLFIADPRTL